MRACAKRFGRAQFGQTVALPGSPFFRQIRQVAPRRPPPEWTKTAEGAVHLGCDLEAVIGVAGVVGDACS